MLTLTITLKGTAHQIELVYDTLESLKKNAVGIMNDGRHHISDDHGRDTHFRGEDVISVEQLEVEQHWAMRGKVSIIKLRAEAKFRLDIEQQPDLRPYVAPVSPKFGG